MCWAFTRNGARETTVRTLDRDRFRDARVRQARIVALLAIAVLNGLTGCSEEAPPDAPAASAPAAAGGERVAAPNPGGALELIRANDAGVGLMGRFEFEAAAAKFKSVRESVPLGADDARREVTVNEAIAILNQSAEGQQEEALEILAGVLEDAPEHLRARYASGLALLFLGRPEEAQPHFAFVAERDPSDAHAAYYHGQCLDLAGRDADALASYRAAAALDPYLRSALLGVQRCLQRLDDKDGAAAALADFQRLADNPRATLAEFKYTRMGRKGEVQSLGAEPAVIALPEGPLFRPSAVLGVLPPLAAGQSEGRSASWGPLPPMATITAADINGDGWTDLFVTNALARGEERLNAVLIRAAPAAGTANSQGPDPSFAVDLEHPLTTFTAHTALWGDLDNNGHIDVVLLGHGVLRVLMQSAAGVWSDATSTALPALDASPEYGEVLIWMNGLLADIDHDGDLDLMVTGMREGGSGAYFAFAGIESGRFRPLDMPGARTWGGLPLGIVAGDFDADRDLDLFIPRAGERHLLLRNDRLWKWLEWPGAAALLDQPILAATSGDLDGDGVTEIVFSDTRARIVSARLVPGHIVPGQIVSGQIVSGRIELPRAVPAEESSLQTIAFTPRAERESPFNSFAITDLRGDGTLRPLSPELLATELGLVDEHIGHWAFATLEPGRGPSLLRLDESGALRHHGPGSGRYPFVDLAFRGRLDPGQSMRSNASGIGTLANIRVGGRWLTRSVLPVRSNPGQSAEPIAVGLGGAEQLDFISLDWSDGVFQSEVAIRPSAPGAGGGSGGPMTTIVETQRQISSCPLIFAWNGRTFAFVSDCLGVGGLGYLVAPGEYAPPRPFEHFLLPEGALVEKDDGLEVRLVEPMEEAVYLDQVTLVAYDLPRGWSMTVDERMELAAPPVTGAPLFHRRALGPVSATSNGLDVFDRLVMPIGTPDHRAVDPGPIDPRFIGRLRDMQEIVLELPQPLEAPSTESSFPLLVAHGWVEYPYGQTNFAAWQEGALYEAPSIDVRDGLGTWSPFLEKFGYPAGMPRSMSVPLSGLPLGTTALRIRSNLDIHWDNMLVAVAEPAPAELVVTRLPVDTAELAICGYPRRSDGEGRRPIYDYNQRLPLADMRTQTGWYTAVGDVRELVREPDEALAIFGPGEEVRLSFDAAALPPLAAGFTRRYVLELRGWCKDMDLFTADGETLEPIPGEPTDAREAIHRRFNTRWNGGR